MQPESVRSTTALAAFAAALLVFTAAFVVPSAAGGRFPRARWARG